MGSTKPLIFVILLSIYIQNIQCKDLGDEIKSANDFLNKPYPLATRDRDLRGFLEQINIAADQIKNRALASWKYLKRVAEGTRRNIRLWVNSARQYATELEKSLAVQLQHWLSSLENLVQEIVRDVAEAGQCLLGGVEPIGNELISILKDLVQCMAGRTTKLRPIMSKQEKMALNDTLFIEDLDRKLDACKADKANYEECLNTVGDLVYEDIKEKHKEIRNTGIELRGLAYNTREGLLDCAVQIIMNAVSALKSAVSKIENCVLRRGINKSIFVTS